MDKILFSNIKTIFTHFHDDKLNVTNLIKQSLIQAQQTKKYNAFITINHKEAEQQSYESLERYSSKKPKSLLDGIPIAIKDNFCTSGIRTTCGSRMLENFLPTYNATIYQRLLDAGAILIGKTNLDQFAMGSGTVDSIYGPTKNVWNYKDDDFHIAGGSSGGSAVAVSTGVCYAGIGSDTGGSVRNPASYCGLIGLKPTYGLVSRSGLISLVNSMDIPGILTRTVDDCVIVLNAIAGYDPKDCTTINRPFRKIRLPSTAKSISIKNLHIGVPREYYSEFLSQEIYDTWKDVLEMLQNHGAIIKQVSMPHTEHSIVCYSILNQCEVASNMARYDGIEYGFRSDEETSTEKLYATSRSLGLSEVVRNRILAGNYFLLERNYEKYFNQALKVRRLISNDFDQVWDDVQVLITPTTLTTAPVYGDFIKKTNRDQCALQDYCTQPANMAGVPALSIPIKLSQDGLPISLQIIGKNFSEPTILALAKFIENAVEFPQKTV